MKKIVLAVIVVMSFSFLSADGIKPSNQELYCSTKVINTKEYKQKRIVDKLQQSGDCKKNDFKELSR